MSGQQFIAAFIKNLKRMFKSPLTLAIIFLGPFLVLFLVQGAYQSGDSIHLNIGLVAYDEQSYTFLVEVFNRRGFDLFEYAAGDACVTDIKNGYLDLCVEFESDDTIDFFVDKSKTNLITMLEVVVVEAMEEQSNLLREQFADTLVGELGGTTVAAGQMQDRFEEFASGNPADLLLGLADDLESGKKSAAEALDDLDAIEADTVRVHQETADDLETFDEHLDDVEDSARHQLNTIRHIEEYNRDCDAMLPLDEDYLENEASYDEVKASFTEYGECMCVDFYRDNLLSIEKDLADVLAYIDDAKDSVADARRRNDEFVQTVSESIAEQREGLIESDASLGEQSLLLRQRAVEIDGSLAGFQESLDEMSDRAADLEEKTASLKGDLVKPISVVFRSIGEDYSLMVYLFPLMFFFVLIFISMTFSATFIHAERSSPALLRNLLAPAKSKVMLLAMFCSLLFLVAMQSVLLLLLGALVFGFPFSLAIFINTFIITLVVLVFYLLLGLIIGCLFRSQIVIMFTTLGISIASFLYSSSITPVNAMMAFARFVVSINPFSIGVESTSRIILHEAPLSVFLSPLMGIIAVSIVLLLVLFAVFRKKYVQ